MPLHAVAHHQAVNSVRAVVHRQIQRHHTVAPHRVRQHVRRVVVLAVVQLAKPHRLIANLALVNPRRAMVDSKVQRINARTIRLAERVVV